MGGNADCPRLCLVPNVEMRRFGSKQWRFIALVAGLFIPFQDASSP
jgi:hypothetical protein